MCRVIVRYPGLEETQGILIQFIDKDTAIVLIGRSFKLIDRLDMTFSDWCD